MDGDIECAQTKEIKKMKNYLFKSVLLFCMTLLSNASFGMEIAAVKENVEVVVTSLDYGAYSREHRRQHETESGFWARVTIDLKAVPVDQCKYIRGLYLSSNHLTEIPAGFIELLAKLFPNLQVLELHENERSPLFSSRLYLIYQ